MAETREPMDAQEPSPWARRAALLVVAVFFVVAARYGWSLSQRAEVGRPAPDFALETVSGERLVLRQVRGSVVVLNFWASWCPPCREETPALQSFHERYGDRVRLWGINEREGPAVIREFLDAFGVTYPTLLDRDGSVGERYGLRAIPETWMIDAKGIARVHHRGAMTFEDLQRAYREATGESIDGDGVGPVAAGGQAYDLAVTGSVLVAATDAGVLAARPDAPLQQPDAWTRLGLERAVYQLAVHRAATGEQLYAATDDGVWVTTLPAGDADTRLGERPWQAAGLQGETVRGIGVANGKILAWVPGRGLLQRESDGRWTPQAFPLPPELPWLTLAYDPAGGGRWLAGFAAGLLAREAGAQEWRQLDVEGAVQDVAVTDGGVYLATDRGIWFSGDGLTAAPMPGHVRQYAGAAVGAGGTWALAPNGDVYRWTEAGWRRVGATAAAGEADR